MIITICKQCNSEFLSKSGRAKFCNAKCKEIHKDDKKEGFFDSRQFEKDMLIDHMFMKTNNSKPICVQVNRIKYDKL